MLIRPKNTDHDEAHSNFSALSLAYTRNTCPRSLTAAFGRDHLLVCGSFWGCLQQIGPFSPCLLHIIHRSIKDLALTALRWFSVAQQSCWALFIIKNNDLQSPHFTTSEMQHCFKHRYTHVQYKHESVVYCMYLLNRQIQCLCQILIKFLTGQQIRACNERL